MNEQSPTGMSRPRGAEGGFPHAGAGADPHRPGTKLGQKPSSVTGQRGTGSRDAIPMSIRRAASSGFQNTSGRAAAPPARQPVAPSIAGIRLSNTIASANGLIRARSSGSERRMSTWNTPFANRQRPFQHHQKGHAEQAEAPYSSRWQGIRVRQQVLRDKTAARRGKSGCRR